MKRTILKNVGTSVMPFNRYVGSGIFVALAL